MNSPKKIYKFYRIVKDKKLFSFGDNIGDVRVGDLTLRNHQDFVIRSIGGTILDIENKEQIDCEENYFYFDENLFFTIQFARKAIDYIDDYNTSLKYCLRENTFNNRFVLPHTKDSNSDLIEFDFCFINTKIEGFNTVVLEQEIYLNFVELPDQIVKGRRFHMDQCDTFASHIISPFHLLQINLALNLNRTIKLQKYIPQKWRRGFGTRLAFRALKRLNKIGKNVKIHPSAIIEGSIIGDNTIIGANAIIRLSNIGKNCTVSEGVSVMNSVLGERTFISNSNYILNCMTYDEVFLIHGPYQFSFYGSNSACFAVINADIRLDQKTIKIPTDIGVIDSNQPLLGIAYGHRSKTGGGSIIASGRIVPNDRIINPPDNIILRFD